MTQRYVVCWLGFWRDHFHSGELGQRPICLLNLQDRELSCLMPLIYISLIEKKLRGPNAMPWPEGGAHVIHDILVPGNATNLIRTARNQATIPFLGMFTRIRGESFDDCTSPNVCLNSRPCSEISCIYIFRHV